mgnify:CR=1 FL=1
MLFRSTVKYDFQASLDYLIKMGYNIYTNDEFYKGLNLIKLDTIVEHITNNTIELLINIPKNIYSDNSPDGFIMRRTCLDYNIPIITNIKCAKLFVSSLREYKQHGLDYTSWNDYISI